MKYQINKEHIGYYKTLEGIRRSGICNMWGAAPYLAEYELRLYAQCGLSALQRS